MQSAKQNGRRFLYGTIGMKRLANSHSKVLLNPSEVVQIVALQNCN
ncbi:hypothetical protein Poly41_26450 [Novipirellula artificiosorum]|uniref:Uncharacterized protein n=1 Tax=Novipirellula artificiosorum TaxID=2528016 RepID=A0A5C6DY73_9BACT|nr:hypothetical protein Poly41_26450 [Novipirellula artificiosorum]